MRDYPVPHPATPGRAPPTSSHSAGSEAPPAITRRVRLTPKSTDLARQVMLDPRRVLRWVYVARLCVATAILLAAAFAWGRAKPADTLAATLAFAAAALCTVGSVVRSEIQRRPLGAGFYAMQALCDLLVVTAAVHVTGGATSQFAALYILVIASAALLLPPAGAVATAALGSA